MRRLRQLPPLSTNEFTGYVGFVDGRPHAHYSAGGYDADSSVVEVFTTKQDAKKRYEDVRSVRMVVEEEAEHAE